jgi:Domain of unknown function (DUF4410)
MKHWVAALAALGLSLGCAPTNVETTYSQSIAMPRPNQVLVYDFAVAPDEVHLDRGVVGKAELAISHKTPTELERVVGHQVAKKLALELAKRINAMGIPAQRAWGMPSHWGNVVVVEGQILSINEGNEAERVAIGLSAGKSDVRAIAQLFAAMPTGLTLLEQFDSDVASGYMPGMAETMGAGAIGGHLAVAAAAGVVTHGVGEEFSASVDAEANRTADAIAKQIRPYFESHGWLSSN